MALIIHKNQSSCKFFKIQKKFKDILIIASFGENKSTNTLESLKILRELAPKIYLTNFSIGQDEYRKSISPRLLSKMAKEANFEQTNVIDKPEQSLNKALNSTVETIVVTGSYYLLNHIRPLITNMKQTNR